MSYTARYLSKIIPPLTENLHTEYSARYYFEHHDKPTNSKHFCPHYSRLSQC